MVKCPNEDQLKRKLKAIKLESNEFYQDLMNKNPKYFYRAHIETWYKSDMVDNNICETFNSCIRKGKKKSFIDFFLIYKGNFNGVDGEASSDH